MRAAHCKNKIRLKWLGLHSAQAQSRRTWQLALSLCTGTLKARLPRNASVHINSMFKPTGNSGYPLQLIDHPLSQTSLRPFAFPLFAFQLCFPALNFYLPASSSPTKRAILTANLCSYYKHKAPQCGPIRLRILTALWRPPMPHATASSHHSTQTALPG